MDAAPPTKRRKRTAADDFREAELEQQRAGLSGPDAKPDQPAPNAAPPAKPGIYDELCSLERQAQAGDAKALPRIRAILDEHPEVWQYAGDLSALAERAWLAVLGAENPVVVESMTRAAAEMRKELAGEHPTRMERMLVDQVISCWMESKYAEAQAACSGPGSIPQATFNLRRLESAQRRHMNAIKILAFVRSQLAGGVATPESIKLFDEGGRQRA